MQYFYESAKKIKNKLLHVVMSVYDPSVLAKVIQMQLKRSKRIKQFYFEEIQQLCGFSTSFTNVAFSRNYCLVTQTLSKSKVKSLSYRLSGVAV